VEKLNKKELRDNYKNRTVTGGIYCIKCNGNGQEWLRSTRDIIGNKNRFDFFVSTDSCPEPGMLKEWKLYGGKSFQLIILEEMKKTDKQTEAEFAEDMALLLEMWLEKQNNLNL